ncbi:MAG: NUDIX hydrolase [Dehalococcoidia bacterium]
MRQWVLIRAQQIPVLRTLAEFAENFFAPRQPIGALAIIVNADGHILIANHATRPHEPWGLPGGWLDRCERPEDGVLREVAEELGIPVTLEAYVGSHEHDYGWLPPRGLTLLFRLATPLTDAGTVRALTWEIAETRWATVEEVCAVVHPRTAAIVRRAMEVPVA